MSEQTKTLSDSVNERLWTAVEVLSLACAINREKGFTSVSKVTFSEPDSADRWTNKDMLCYTLVPEITPKTFNLMFKVKPCDLEEAEAIIKYYRRLSFGVLSETLNDYLQSVFRVTQTEQVKFKDFGILASVPSVYEREIHAKETLEQIKTTKDQHIGQEGQSVILKILVIETKFLDKINCWAHLAITSEDNLVSFLHKTKLIERKATATVKAKIKKHNQHWKTKTAETQLNYVKIVDDVLSWQ